MSEREHTAVPFPCSPRPLLFLRNLQQYLTRAMQRSSWINVAVCFFFFFFLAPPYGSAKTLIGLFVPGQKTHTRRQWTGMLHAIHTSLEWMLGRTLTVPGEHSRWVGSSTVISPEAHTWAASRSGPHAPAARPGSSSTSDQARPVTVCVLEKAVWLQRLRVWPLQSDHGFHVQVYSFCTAQELQTQVRQPTSLASQLC